MTRYWLGVVSREHVRRGVALGIAQANHGRRTPLERMRPGEGLVYYSPREAVRTGAPVRSFTAIGTIDDRPAWQMEPTPPMPGATVAADLPPTAMALDLGLPVAPEPGGGSAGAGCLRPWRRSVTYHRGAREVPIDELRDELALTSAPNWGIALRRGLIELSVEDFALIARAMVDGYRADDTRRLPICRDREIERGR